MILADFVRISKEEDAQKYAARWYKNKNTGEKISRWQYQTLQAGGLLNPRERAEIRRNAGIRTLTTKRHDKYNRLARAYKINQAAKLGVKVKDIKTRGNSASALEFKAKAKALKQFTKADWADKSANGKVSQLLVQLGMREPEWDMPRGESPK